MHTYTMQSTVPADNPPPPQFFGPEDVQPSGHAQTVVKVIC